MLSRIASPGNQNSQVDGYVDLPRRPGVGIELDEDALADKIGHEWRNRETYDLDDGSVADW